MPTRLAFLGDLQLGSELRHIIPAQERRVTQLFDGVDRSRALIVPASPNITYNLNVITFFAPESTYSKESFRAREWLIREALISRSEATYPLIWATELNKTVSNYTGSTVTAAGHGMSNGNYTLIRRNGVGLYTLSAIGNVATDTFDITAGHAVQAGDDVYLVERYWNGCLFVAFESLEPSENGDYYSEMGKFTFACSGSSYYSKTSVTMW